MKRGEIRKILLGTVTSFILLTVVLVIHIYIVTRPGKPNEKTIAMARIDIHQNITPGDASKIGAWLYQQKGVDHVLCNTQSEMVVFTFYPVKASADEIVNNFKTNLNYPNAVRFMPSAEDMQKGCPAMAGSVSYKLVSFIKHIL